MHFWDRPDRFWEGPGPGPPGRVLAGPDGDWVRDGPEGKSITDFRLLFALWGVQKSLKMLHFRPGRVQNRPVPSRSGPRILGPPGESLFWPIFPHFSPRPILGDFGRFFQYVCDFLKKISGKPAKKPNYLKKLAHRIPIIMHFWDRPDRFWEASRDRISAWDRAGTGVLGEGPKVGYPRPGGSGGVRGSGPGPGISMGPPGRPRH